MPESGACLGYGDCTMTEGLCHSITHSLGDIVGDANNPMFKRTPLGYIEALTSPGNKAGVEIKLQEGEKKKVARVIYTPRAIEEQVSDECPEDGGDCITDNCPEPCEEDIDVDLCATYEFKFKQDQVARICPDNEVAFWSNHIKSAYNALALKINGDLLAIQALNMGINYGNGGVNTVKAVNAYTAANGNPFALPAQEIEYDYKINEYFGRPMAIGAGNFYRWYKAVSTAGCCNDGGLDLKRELDSLGIDMWFDATVDNAIEGNNNIILLSPGNQQFIQYNRYNTENRVYKMDDGSAHVEINDPHLGIKYDMKIIYDSCEDFYYFKIFTTYTLWQLPLGAYHPNDPIYGTNGSAWYQFNTV